MPLIPAWGLYNNQKINPVPLEDAYQHKFLLFTEQLHIGVPVALGGPDSSDSSALVDPGTQAVGNMNARLCLEVARKTTGTVFSIGINCVIGGAVIPHPGYVDAYAAVAGGLYNAEIDLWADALIAYKAMGVVSLHALFQLEPAQVNQPAYKGSGPNYKLAFANVYARFAAKGVQAAGIKLGWDSSSADWRSTGSATALAFQPTVYDICSADFYPASAPVTTKTLEWGLGKFFDNARDNHPGKPVLIRSVSPKTLTDAEAATWFTDANNTLLNRPIPDLLGVGWDPNNQFLDDLDPGEVYPNYVRHPQTKTAFRNMAIPWATSVAGTTNQPFPPLIDQTGVLFVPKVNRLLIAPLIDQTGVMVTLSMRVRRGINMSLITQTGVVFTPSKVNMSLGAFGSPVRLIDQSGVLFAPSISRITPPLIDQTGVLFAPGITKAGDAYPLIDQSGVLFTHKFNLSVLLNDAGSELWDGASIWDSGAETWDGAILFAGHFIDQTGVLFTPTFPGSPRPPLIDQSGVLFGFQINPQSLQMPIKDRSGVVFTPQINSQMNPDIIDQSGVLFAPTASVTQTVTAGLIDQSATMTAFQIDPPQLQMPIKDRSGILFTPDSILAGRSIDMSFIDQTGQMFAFCIVNMPLINQSGVLFALFVNPPSLVVRFDDFDAQFLDNSGILYEPSASLGAAPPEEVYVALISNTGQVFAPVVHQFGLNPVFLEAAYEPTMVLSASFSPILRKEASLLGKLSPITKLDEWFKGEDQTFIWEFPPDEDITGYTIVFKMALSQGAAALMTKTADVVLSTMAQVVSAPSDTASLVARKYWYELARTDTGSKQVLASGDAFLLARVG